MILATKTLQAIADAINADGGAAYRKNLQMVLPHIGDAYSADSDPYRSHLGASVIGGPCDRALWFGFRWASTARPTGKAKEDNAHGYARMVRLWNRGHLEEGRFIALLLTIGVQVFQQDANGKQFRISHFGGHFGGSGDGVLLGVPDLPPGVPAGAEFKTHSDDTFKELLEKGVKESKPEHYVQMQQYMRGFGLQYFLYLAVNKNTDELHGEIVCYDGVTDERYLERARSIIFDERIPSRMRMATPTHWKCKHGCGYNAVCWGAVKPDVNCRTCKHVAFYDDGSVRCIVPEHPCGEGRDVSLNKAEQLAGCDRYEVSPLFKV